MRRHHAHLVRDGQYVERRCSGLHRLPVRRRAHDDADERFHCGIVACGVRDVSLHGAPGPLALWPVAPGRERREDGLRIDFAHELADVLALPGAGGAAANVACLLDGLSQTLRQFEREKVCIFKQYQLLAQPLRGERLALARALARFILGRALHGGLGTNAARRGCYNCA